MDATPFIGVIELAHLDLASRRIRRREKLASELVQYRQTGKNIGQWPKMFILIIHHNSISNSSQFKDLKAVFACVDRTVLHHFNAENDFSLHLFLLALYLLLEWPSTVVTRKDKKRATNIFILVKCTS